jgi:hypothetical protein
MIKSHNFLTERFTKIEEFFAHLLPRSSGKFPESQCDFSLFSFSDKVRQASVKYNFSGNTSDRPAILWPMVSLSWFTARLSVAAKIIFTPYNKPRVTVADSDLKSVSNISALEISGTVNADSAFPVDVRSESYPVDFGWVHAGYYTT